MVYHAHDPVIDREIALKAVPTNDTDPAALEFRARFLREARAAGRLSHPGIVTVYDVGEDEDHRLLYLTMEFVEGCSLKDVRAAGVRLDDHEIVALGVRLAEALDVAHRNGVVHRDLKPANVLLSRDGEVKLVDFGVARLDTSDLTKDGSSVGTPFYMSPEQILGRPVDGRSDLYSLGVILYELLAERRPFSASGIGDLAVQIADDPPPPLGELRPDLEGTLAPVVHRLLAKRPDDRFSSGGDVAEALRAFNGTGAEAAIRRTVAAAARRSDGPAAEHVGGQASAGGEPLDTRSVGEIPAARQGAGLRRWAGIAAVAIAVIGVTLVLAAIFRSQGLERPLPSDVEASELHEDVQRLRAAADLLETGDREGARRMAEDILDRRPGSRAAGMIVDAATAVRATATPVVPAAPSPTERPSRRRAASAAVPSTPTPTVTPTPAPTPLAPVLEVVFLTPLDEGSLVLEVDFERIEEIRWDLADVAATGSGDGVHEVRREVALPSGSHQLEIQLHAGRRGQVGMAVFDRDFEPDSRWSVTVELPGRRQRPTFRLERADQAP